MFEKLKSIAKADNLGSILDLAIQETEEELLDLLRLQLSSGQKGDGQMPQYKSINYAKRKQRRGSLAPFGVMDLRFTGDFQDKFRATITKKGVRIRSYDKKNSILMNKYGKEIFQLNPENLSIYVNQILQPVFINKVKDELFKQA